jgi:hypothetical protein
MGRAIDPETGKTGLFGISSPIGMIRNPPNRINEDPLMLVTIPREASSVGASIILPTKKDVRDYIRLHKRANSGAWIWKYGIIEVGSPEFCMKWVLK